MATRTDDPSRPAETEPFGITRVSRWLFDSNVLFPLFLPRADVLPWRLL
jgi:hypothetical protein